ncbi:acid protease [Daedalea quercina L-15889]|uniref:Acid protease n=1 Tax=Daedalea quercina L-15889 TaxID=1314783 RepID=A0A165Q7D1_9APHY|nr:acid protease [Daedalea quercina L-15889]
MYRRILSLSFLVSTVLSSVFAIHIPLRREFVSARDGYSHTVAVTKSSSSSNLTGFDNYYDVRYIGSITISGQSYEVYPFLKRDLYAKTNPCCANIIQVILDTGSPDLWIVTDSALSGSVNTSVPAELDYGTDAADGSSIQGYIFTAEVEFGGFTIAQQAYIDVPNNTAASSTPLSPGLSGLIGLSPLMESSTIATNLNASGYNASGRNPLQNIFYNDPSVPPQFSILMSRNDGDIVSSGGNFTIGDPVPEYAGIQDTPILPVGSDNEVLAQHWAVHVDAIVINGQWYNTSSGGAENLTAILDTGTPTAYIDTRFVDIMYGANAQHVETDFSAAPCDAQINVTLVFGGVEFPINPIDVIQPINVENNGTVVCDGAFARLDGFPDGTFLLGDTFLRNAYTLYNLNIGNSSQAEIGPYVQMLSMTNAEQAAADFASLNKQRLQAFAEAFSEAQGSSSSISDDDSDLSAAVSSPTPSSSSSDDYSALMRNSYIIIGLMATALFLLVVIAALLFRRARQSPQRAYKPVGADKFDNVPLQYESYNATYKD